MLVANYCLALDLNAILSCAWPAKEVQESRTLIGISGGTPLRLVTVADNELSHFRSPFVGLASPSEGDR